jgi:hypothetical protein
MRRILAIRAGAGGGKRRQAAALKLSSAGPRISTTAAMARRSVTARVTVRPFAVMTECDYHALMNPMRLAEPESHPSGHLRKGPGGRSPTNPDRIDDGRAEPGRSPVQNVTVK